MHATPGTGGVVPVVVGRPWLSVNAQPIERPGVQSLHSDSI